MKILVIVIVIVVVIIGGVLLLKNSGSQGPTYSSMPTYSLEVSFSPIPIVTSPTSSITPKASPTPTPTPIPTHPITPTSTPRATPTQQTTQYFDISADDSGATPSSVTVTRGASVSITFHVSSTNVYYGGLDFRSSVISSGAIAPGSSKTITFTAQDSFSFTPYWPASNVAKPYMISVVVK